MNRNIVISVGLTIAALIVVVWLAGRAGLSLDSVLSQLVQQPLWLVPVITLLTGSQIAISAVKWRVVIEKLSPELRDNSGFSFYFVVSVASAFLSQIFTVYLSSLIARSWAAKRFHGVEIKKGAGSSLFEQVFDAAIIVAFAIPAACSLLLGFDALTWASLTLLFWAATLFGVMNIDLVVRILGRGATGKGRVSQAINSVGKIAASGIFERGMLSQLYLMSTARYLLIAVRAPIIAATMLTILPTIAVLQGFALVQATQLASLTPGNLGIQEWTWTGVLTVQDVTFADAASFAIAFRIVTFLAMSLVAIGVSAFQTIRQGVEA